MLTAIENATQLIWDRTQGDPFLIQLLAFFSFSAARDETRVTVEHINRAIDELLDSLMA